MLSVVMASGCPIKTSADKVVPLTGGGALVDNEE